MSPDGSSSSATHAPSSRAVLVWDAPVRLAHWLMVASFAGAYLTAESERWRLLHVTLGYTLAALVVFRLVWGLVGTRHARFASFVRGPRAVMAYLRSLLSRHPEHHVGHNPAGALAIIALLATALLITATGYATYNELGGEWLEELHEGAANAMLALVAVHIGGVVVSSWLHRENLVRSMVTGRKDASPDEGIRSAWRSLAAIMLVAVLGFWWWQWQSAPTGDLSSNAPTATQAPGHDDRGRGKGRDRDDD
ncbi:cytochrome b/b6 domain-containing protein [Ideonella sp. A 288]|uniref:cytochrome b/b6 domain-containing protein n=1 Tax=Ideonella sp. A 288 TaxID=1962181 RepID=UPI00210068EC|nr:cytochrome b/b6 domain-containing protein [Ideonella sp. A 288]